MRCLLLGLVFLGLIAGCDQAPKGRATPGGVIERPKVERSGQPTKIDMH